MKSVAIYYFSGTGNTEIVAKMVKEAFENQSCSVDLIRIEDVLKKKLSVDIKQYDLIGIGSQVIGYGTPLIVRDFVRSLPEGTGKKVFIFRTAGGVAPINYNVSKAIIRKLNRKGFEVVYERLFSIASNWVVKFDDGAIHQLHQATAKKVTLMCQEIINGEKRFLKTGLGQRLLMETVAFIAQPTLRLVGKDFKVTDACTNCGLCVKNCPAENISERNGKIKFKLSCNSCLRCVYACPQNAIQFNTLKFFPVSGGYNIKKTLSQPVPPDAEANGAIPPFLSQYLRNDAL